MRIASGLMVATLLAAGAVAAEPAVPAAASSQRPQFDAELIELDIRARQLRPRRRDTPLRDLNIADFEVREVQQVAGKYKMLQLVNISPVVTSCPCEEGGGCTEQVFVVGDIEGKSQGLQFSRRKNKWDISRVQKWWLEYSALQALKSAMSHRAFLDAKARLLMEMPQCGSPGKSVTKPVNVAQTQKSR